VPYVEVPRAAMQDRGAVQGRGGMAGVCGIGTERCVGRGFCGDEEEGFQGGPRGLCLLCGWGGDVHLAFLGRMERFPGYVI